MRTQMALKSRNVMGGYISGSQNSSGQESGPTRIQRELRIVQLLFDISQALNASLDLKETMRPVLMLLFDYFGAICSTIVLTTCETGETDLELIHGLSREKSSGSPIGLMRSVARKVMNTGAAKIVETVSREFLTQNRSDGRVDHATGENVSFIAVPIKGCNGIMGAVGAGCFRSEGLSIDEEVRLLTAIAPLLAQAIEIRREAGERERILQQENSRLQSEILEYFKPVNIVGNSHAIHHVCRLINQVSPCQASVFITGEPGVGKELVAEAVHVNSPRSDKSFVTVNLAALPENSIESELFGQCRGAFSGATERKGQLELADGGTLFLDEVSRLPMPTQVRLLRFLQEKEFERLGDNKTIRSDARIISSTDRNLEELIRNFQFRQDLYYRLNVFPIFVPPLRERKTDILILANHFVDRLTKRLGKSISRISATAMDMMMSYRWPGNVRELESCIERAMMLSSDGIIHARFLPPSIQTAESTRTRQPGNLKLALDTLESELIVDALRSAGGNIVHAANALGISRKLMRLRIEKYEINPRDFHGIHLGKPIFERNLES